MSVTHQKRKEVVQYLLQQQVLVTGDLLSRLDSETVLNKVHTELQENPTADHILAIITQKNQPKPQNAAPAQTSVTIVKEYEQADKKITYNTFTAMFNKRFKALELMLKQRTELRHTTSISRLGGIKPREQVTLIAMVDEIRETKNNNIALTLEDPTGKTKVIVTQNNKDLFAIAQDLVLDEVIGVVGMKGNGIIFASSILHPDIPLNREIKKCPDDVYMAVVGDFHVGSNLFTEKTLANFVKWLRGETQDQQEIAKKTKYLFIVGDLVDSVGVYPSQEHELVIKDVYQQFEHVAKYLRQIPEDVHIIICPGNHEPTRIAEPQPKIDPDYGKVLYDLPNTTFVTNPGTVRIHETDAFPGFDVLMYHGFSYTWYGDNVHSIRTSALNISERVEPIMKYLLQRRHLAPAYGSNQFVPDERFDPLVIEHIPDFFLSGHIHKSSVGQYRGVTTISCSCFQRMSSYQEKFGHVPDPGKVPIVNLKTRQGKILNFYAEDD